MSNATDINIELMAWMVVSFKPFVMHIFAVADMGQDENPEDARFVRQ